MRIQRPRKPGKEPAHETLMRYMAGESYPSLKTKTFREAKAMRALIANIARYHGVRLSTSVEGCTVTLGPAKGTR